MKKKKSVKKKPIITSAMPTWGELVAFMNQKKKSK